VKHPADEAGGAGPPPDVVRALFPSDRLVLIEQYGRLLATDGVARGLIGPREVPRIWDRHVVNCALLATALPRDASVADVGSGAGLPGVVLALARPDLQMTLIEPLLRRTTFLDEVVEALGLDNVVVRRERADALHGQQAFDVVTARAVAPLDRLLRWCMPLVTASGSLVAMKGDSAEDEIAAARPVLTELGCGEPSIEVITVPPADRATSQDSDHGPGPQTRLVRVTWADPARVSLPTSGGRGGSRTGHRRPARRRRGPA
jgi:16S rRNA (guanine527-N7)-methyltransferase